MTKLSKSYESAMLRAMQGFPLSNGSNLTTDCINPYYQNLAHKAVVNDETRQNQSLHLIKLLGSCTVFLLALGSSILPNFYRIGSSICDRIGSSVNVMSYIIMTFIDSESRLGGSSL